MSRDNSKTYLNDILYMFKDKKEILTENAVFFQFCIENLKDTNSQSFQDLWVLYEKTRLGEYRPRKFYVEFGAHDGIEGSNTLLLQKKYWEGLLVEPDPFVYPELVKNRSNVSTVIDSKAVYTSSDEWVDFTQTIENHQFSTISHYYDNSDKFTEKNLSVRTITLSDLLETWDLPSRIDYISVDTEGSEPDIMEKFFSENTKYSVDMFTIEHNFKNRDVLYEIMTSNGYERKFPEYSRWDDFWIRKELV